MATYFILQNRIATFPNRDHFWVMGFSLLAAMVKVTFFVALSFKGQSHRDSGAIR